MLLLLFACSGSPPAASDSPKSTDAPAAARLADVTAVEATGDPGAYTFLVTVASPDTGCSQYADWWEVLSAEGTLRYRRILEHSHPDEQPFSRDGGPVPVTADETLIVRAHLAPGGYGGAALRGTVAGGFVAAADVGASFAAGVESGAPQPEGCAF